MEAEQLTTRLMEGQYRVVDLRSDTAMPRTTVVSRAYNSQAAAKSVLGMDLTRSGRPKDLQAKVYFVDRSGILNMVRLHRKSENSEK
jgi:hypothetical protein